MKAVNVFIAILILVAIMYSCSARAGGDELTNISKNENLATGGSVGGNDSVALASALGDVDISDCLASKQMSVMIVWQHQWIVENPLCVAATLDAAGSYAAAAKVRCMTQTLQAAYPDETECIRMVTTKPLTMPPPKPPPTPPLADKDDEDYHGELEARLEAIEAKRTTLANLERQVQQQQAIIEQHQEPIIIDAGAERRARARAAYDEALGEK